MLDALRIAFAPLYVSWRVLAFAYSTQKDIRKRLKLWYRQPAYGTAGFASYKELKGGTGFVLGKLDGKVVRTTHEACVVMFGARGAGKSATIGGTLNLIEGENAIVLDPPKKLYERFCGSLEAKGYRVIRIDLDDPTAGVGYDPAAFLDGSNDLTWDKNVREVANLLVADIEVGGKHGSHFRDLAAIFIKGMLAWLHVNDRAKASPYGVAEILLIKTDLERDEAFKEMLKNADASVRTAINAWRSVGPNEGGSFRSTLTNALECWLWKSYRALTEAPERLNWDDVFLHDGPVAVFLTGGVMDNDTNRHFVRMFFGQAASTLARLYARVGRELPRKTLIMIDEGSVVGNCQPLIKVVEQLRKVGVNLFIAYQSFSQLHSAYSKEDADTLMTNSDWIVCGGLKDPRNYESISKMIGSRTVNPMTKGRDVSVGESPRYVCGPDELFKLPNDKVVALVGNLPAKLDKVYRIVRGELRY